MQNIDTKKIISVLSKTLKTKHIKIIRIEFNRYNDKEYEITINVDKNNIHK